MICMKCGKVLNFEKIITPDGKAYHVHCWNKGTGSGSRVET
jgi:hypothetical protein